MTRVLRSLTAAILFIAASFGSQAMAAGESLKQKSVTCGNEATRILRVEDGQRVEIFDIFLSSSTGTQAEVILGKDTLLVSFMRQRDNVQFNLDGFTGGSGKSLKVKCTGVGQLSVTLSFTLGGLP